MERLGVDLLAVLNGVLANYGGRINEILVQVLNDGLDAEISWDGDKALHRAMCMPVYMGPYH